MQYDVFVSLCKVWSYVQLLPFEILSAQHGIPTVVEKYIFLVTSDKNRVYYDLAKPFFE